jgi:hypothetical protein
MEDALGWLRPQLLRAATEPDNPWALAHGLLAFGAELQTETGRSAIDAILGFAERDAAGPGTGHGYPRERDGQPIEPHRHLMLKDLLDAQVPLKYSAGGHDGSSVSVQALADSMWRSARLPDSDAAWYDAPWLLQAMLRTEPPRDVKDGAALLASLRAAALQRLVDDDAPLRASEGPAAQAFAAGSALGLAKRNHSHLYGHACGGFHLMQAVIQAVAAGGDAAQRATLLEELALLPRRHAAERALYASMRAQVPTLELEVTVQELKFFGHLLETLGEPGLDGLIRDNAEPGAALDALRTACTADLLATLARLRSLQAYEQLEGLRTVKPQLRLDLIGDGCHAIRALTRQMARG